MILDNKCWADFRSQTPVHARIQAQGGQALPCLFLDRDGVVVEDVGHLFKVNELKLVDGAAALIRAANDAGWLCGLVTNQSGIASGLFTWTEFASIQEEIDRRLGESGARLDFVLCCPFVNDPDADGTHPKLHGWRKPNPGMFEAVLDHYDISPAASVMIGDKLDDLIAADQCGIGRLVHVLTGHGPEHRQPVLDWMPGNRRGMLARSIGDPVIRDCIEADPNASSRS